MREGNIQGPEREGQRTEGETQWGEWLRLIAKEKEGIAGFFGGLEQSVSLAPQAREDKV